MTDPDGPQSGGRTLAALAKLPPTAGIFYRGLPADGEPLVATTITAAMITTSRDPRVASDNFAHDRMFAIVARKARELGELAEHPEEGELVLLPGTVLVPVGQIRVSSMGATVQILEEVDPGAGHGMSVGLPESIDTLLDRVVGQVSAARKAEPVTLTSPGKFAGAIV